MANSCAGGIRTGNLVDRGACSKRFKSSRGAPLLVSSSLSPLSEIQKIDNSEATCLV